MIFASLSLRRLEFNPLARALALSLVLHFLVFGVMSLSPRLKWLDFIPVIRQLRQVLSAPPQITRVQAQKPPVPAEQEIPLVFVDVDPEVATAEPPEKAPYYSSVSSKAANPTVTQPSEVPKIDGNQTRIPKTFDTLRPEPEPVPQPAPPPPPAEPQPVQPAEVASKPAGGEQVGDLAMAKPRPKPGVEEQEEKPEKKEIPKPRVSRPRTLAEALRQRGIVVSEKMKQDGGVPQTGKLSLNVRGTSFGAYDAAIVAAVQSRWYALLDERKFAGDNVGRVVLEFRLHQDGRITDVKTDSEVGELLSSLCRMAILDPSPYPEWPSDMRRKIGATFRDVRFTFYYD
jgi:hypothetical protein